MNTPLGILGDFAGFDMDTPPARHTRSALMEVSFRPGVTMVTPTSNINTLPTPSPSPDELVIQLRGRRRVPATWSPEMKDRTPVKLPPSPSKSSIVLRSTPRKRLHMGDLSDPPSPERTPRKVSRMATSLGSLSLQVMAYQLFQEFKIYALFS
jgi:hypothetical protein